MSTRVCLVNDKDCVPYGELRRELCPVHYRWLTVYGTTDPQQRFKPAAIVGRLDVDAYKVDRLLHACRLGQEPAESLPTYAREWLVHELWSNGWTDVEIAIWTRMTVYTTVRIRTRLGLAANSVRGAAA